MIILRKEIIFMFVFESRLLDKTSSLKKEETLVDYRRKLLY